MCVNESEYSASFRSAKRSKKPVSDGVSLRLPHLYRVTIDDDLRSLLKLKYSLEKRDLLALDLLLATTCVETINLTENWCNERENYNIRESIVWLKVRQYLILLVHDLSGISFSSI